MSSCGHPTLEDLPGNVMSNILSRLPVKTIIHCKCVCKTWRNLVTDPYFANLHLSISHQGLMIYHTSKNLLVAYEPGFLNFVEMEDEINHQRLLHDSVLNLDLDAAAIFTKDTIARMVGSVNGLICLREFHRLSGDTTYIFNPIVGHFIILPKPQFTEKEVQWGFGVSVAGEYKVIRIFQEFYSPNPVEIEVYTVGVDPEWRNIGQCPDYVRRHDWVSNGLYLNGYFRRGEWVSDGLYVNGCFRRGEWVNNGLYLNGYVHWIDGDIIYAFDLDKETFELFGSPPRQETNKYSILGILKGCISVFFCSSFGFTIWVMQEHGNKQSWHKKLEIDNNIISCLYSGLWPPVCLIDGLNDTSILILVDKKKRKLVGCCLETNRVEETKIHGDIFQVMNYRPSFLKL